MRDIVLKYNNLFKSYERARVYFISYYIQIHNTKIINSSDNNNMIYRAIYNIINSESRYSLAISYTTVDYNYFLFPAIPSDRVLHTGHINYSDIASNSILKDKIWEKFYRLKRKRPLDAIGMQVKVAVDDVEESICSRFKKQSSKTWSKQFKYKKDPRYRS